MGFANADETRVKMKENKQVDKYQYLAREQNKLWRRKLIQIVLGSLLSPRNSKRHWKKLVVWLVGFYGISTFLG